METVNTKSYNLQDKLNGMERELEDYKGYIFYLNELLNNLLNDIINFDNHQFSDVILKEASQAVLDPSTRFNYFNKIKAQAIEEFSNTLTEPMDYRLTYRTLNELLSEHANKLRGE